MPGNRPTTLIWLPDLSPRNVGALIALYEHATVVAGMVWQIDPFDQWGVERGKELAMELLPLIAQSHAKPTGAAIDPSTAASIHFLHTGEAQEL
jgi:glucose-6-phosphate isomerase